MRTSSKALSFGKTDLLRTFAAFTINFHAGVFYACAVSRIRKALVLLGSDGVTLPAAWSKATIRT
jgi:hypothetical protein